jgi:hypothetical protein
MRGTERRGTVHQPELEEALTTIARTQQAVRRAVLRWTLAPSLAAWGLVWLIGFPASLLLAGDALTLLWIGLVALGLAVSFGTQFLTARRLRSPQGRRLGLSWAVASGYLGLWASLLFPRDPELASFVLVTAIMAGYVLYGIWITPFMAILGLFVTAVAVVGHLLGPAPYALLVGLLGGSALIAGGLRVWWSSRDDAR